MFRVWDLGFRGVQGGLGVWRGFGGLGKGVKGFSAHRGFRVYGLGAWGFALFYQQEKRPLTNSSAAARQCTVTLKP